MPGTTEARSYRRHLLTCALAASAGLACVVPPDSAGSLSAAPESGAEGRPPIRPGGYDLGKAPVFSKALMYVADDFFDKGRLNWPRLFAGSLEFIQWDTPEVMVEHWYDAKEPWVSLRVNGASEKFPVPGFTGPWRFEMLMRRILAYIQDHLPPVPVEEEGPRLVRIEVAATNGMLSALDPHSTLLDAEAYRGAVGPSGPSGTIGVTLESKDSDEVEITRVIESGPAALAGLIPGDRLVRIDDLPVRHMNLPDIIAQLRGGAGTTMQLLVSRGGEERLVPIKRDFLKSLDSVSAHYVQSVGLGTGKEKPVGYLRLERFAGDAERAVLEALAEFAEVGVQGVILDLRGNGGGLYDQAVKVADAFLKSGRIVAMVAPGGQRKDETAANSGREPAAPLVVLVDHGSAASAEVVVTALRDNDRAIVVGEKTFGGATVQLFFPIKSPLSASEKLALRLTTAQWLTPANASIQGTGLTPDIVLIPENVREAKDEPPLQLQAMRPRSEAGYDAALVGMGAAPDAHPYAVVPFVYLAGQRPVHAPEFVRSASRFADAGGRDFAITFAKGLLGAVASASRLRALEESKRFVEQARAEQELRLVSELRKRSIDWTAGGSWSAGGPLAIEVTAGDAKLGDGQKIVVRGVARNGGTVPLHRVRAVLDTPSGLVDGKELTFGAIEPGRSRAAEVTIKAPPETAAASQLVTVHGACDECGVTDSEFVIQTGGRAPPVFSIEYQTADAPNTPGVDKIVQSRRRQVTVKVRNIGAGEARNLMVVLRNAPGQEDVRIDQGRFRAEHLDRGKDVGFSFMYEDLLDGRDEPYRFDLLLGEEGTDNVAKHRLSFERGGAGAAAGHVTPPIVSASAPTIVHAASVRVTGEASSAGGLRDLFVTVQRLGTRRLSRKVFYLPSPGGQSRLPFAADIPLEEGSNYLRVTARGADGASTNYPLAVLFSRERAK